MHPYRANQEALLRDCYVNAVACVCAVYQPMYQVCMERLVGVGALDTSRYQDRVQLNNGGRHRNARAHSTAQHGTAQHSTAHVHAGITQNSVSGAPDEFTRQ